MSLCGKDISLIDNSSNNSKLKIYKLAFKYGFKLLAIPFVIYALTISNSNKEFYSNLSTL